MSINLDSVGLFPETVQNLLDTAWSKVTGIFGQFDRREFAPGQSLERLTNLDPYFVPKAPMGRENLDPGLLAKLSHMGMKRGKEITPETHPDLYRAWMSLAMRAGMTRVPQLIVAESKILNAASIHGENAVVVTTGLLQHLNAREVVAVLGHEMGHESSDHTKPRIIALGLLGGAGIFAGERLAEKGGIGSLIKDVENPGPLRRVGHMLFGKGQKSLYFLGAAAYMWIGGLVGTIAANQVSVRPTELDADWKGALISGDPEGLVSALYKLKEQRPKDAGQFYRKLKSGYPSTEARVENLRSKAAAHGPLEPVFAVITPPVAPGMPQAAVAPEMAVPGAQVHAVTQPERVAAGPSPVAQL